MKGLPEVDHLARRAAAALAQRPGFHTNLPLEVEKRILHGGPDDRPPAQMPVGAAEAIALAGFLLSCAQFAWQVWKDTQGDAEATARTLRLQVDKPSLVTVGQRDQVIAVVVEQPPGKA